MIASPFGEKFHFRTHLSPEECWTRIDKHSPTLPDVLGASFGDDPVMVRKYGWLEAWYAHEQYGAKLIARLRARNGGAEIVGRAGSNATLFAGVVVATGLIAVMLAQATADEALETPYAFAALLLPAGYYFLKRRSPNGGGLIDFLQQLLEAENVLERKGDPILRY